MLMNQLLSSGAPAEPLGPNPCRFLKTNICFWRTKPGKEKYLKDLCRDRCNLRPCHAARMATEPDYRQRLPVKKARRRARKRGLPDTLTLEQWRDILDRHDHRCYYCGEEFTDDNPLTLDHVVPVSQGGGTTAANCRPCCYECNQRKGARTPAQAGMFITNWGLLLPAGD
jgi:5-methylcytosine-specific restriction endonuclease McrA